MKCSFTVEEGDKIIAIDIGFKEVSDLISSIEDSGDNEGIFSMLSRHPSAQVRTSVAEKKNLSAEAVQVLMRDHNASVVEALLSTGENRAIIPIQAIISCIEQSPYLVSNAFEIMERFRAEERHLMEISILSNPDPEVRQQLIYERVSTKTMEKLANDTDPSVRMQAQRKIDNQDALDIDDGEDKSIEFDLDLDPMLDDDER